MIGPETVTEEPLAFVHEELELPPTIPLVDDTVTAPLLVTSAPFPRLICPAIVKLQPDKNDGSVVPLMVNVPVLLTPVPPVPLIWDEAPLTVTPEEPLRVPLTIKLPETVRRLAPHPKVELALSNKVSVTVNAPPMVAPLAFVLAIVRFA